MDKARLLSEYELFRCGDSGVGSLVCDSMPEDVVSGVGRLDDAPISKVQLNQLFVLSRAGSMSDGFFTYYWRLVPEHPYDVTKLPYYDQAAIADDAQNVVSHDHLRWGLYRIFVDGLLYFGNVAAAYEFLRSKSLETIKEFFKQKRFDTGAISLRAPLWPFRISRRTIDI